MSDKNNSTTVKTNTSQQSPEAAASAPSSEINKDFLNESEEESPPPAEEAKPADGSTEEKPTEEVKPPAEEEPAPPAEEAKPEDGSTQETDEGYEIDFGESTVLSEQDQDAVAELISDLGLTKDQADKIVSSLNSLSINQQASKASSFEQAIIKDQKELIAHENWKTPEAQKESGRLMSEAIKNFGSPELKEFMKSSRADNVHLMNFFRNIGEAMQSDDFKGKGTVVGGQEETTIGQRLYPEFYKSK